MQNDLIVISEFCNQYHIEPDFVLMLGEDGLIDVVRNDSCSCFHASQLAELERYAHLYYDLSINIAGIDAIRHLLSRMETLQSQIRQLEEELRFYRR